MDNDQLKQSKEALLVINWCKKNNVRTCKDSKNITLYSMVDLGAAIDDKFACRYKTNHSSYGHIIDINGHNHLCKVLTLRGVMEYLFTTRRPKARQLLKELLDLMAEKI